MKRITLLLIFTISATVKSQDLQRQMLAAQGNSKIISNGMYLSQSIGQQSVSGTSQKKFHGFSQGYQHSLWNSYIPTHNRSSVRVTTFPNPFFDTINFQFSQTVNTRVEVTLFDLTGKKVFQESKLPQDNLLTVSNLQLPTANYLVHLVTGKLNYNTQIIQY